jgi:hypothetical protein
VDGDLTRVKLNAIVVDAYENRVLKPDGFPKRNTESLPKGSSYGSASAASAARPSSREHWHCFDPRPVDNLSVASETFA